SVWMYDTGADVWSSNYIGLSLGNTQDTSVRGQLFTFDYDLGPGQNGSTYYYNPNPSTTVSTGVDRTQGWHQFTIDVTPALATFYVDGVSVYSTTDSDPFDQVGLFMSGPSWRPAWTSCFDDFAFDTGNTQSVAVNNGQLVVAGDQLGSNYN